MNVVMYLSSQKSSFTDTLDKEQKEVYDKIVMERSDLSHKGYVMGLTLGLSAAWILRLSGSKYTNAHLFTVVVAVMFVAHYLYYMLMPKSQYMLNNLKDEKQVKAWTEMYRTMQFRHFTGLGLGVASAVILGWYNSCY
jgi:hypothetical protein